MGQQVRSNITNSCFADTGEPKPNPHAAHVAMAESDRQELMVGPAAAVEGCPCDLDR